jgi:hypothetical protein
MRIIGGSTALAFAAVLGSVACVDRSATQGLVFRWRWTALIWMALGAVAGWYLWHLVRVADDSHTPRARKRLMVYLVILALCGVAVFVFPIIFVPAGQFREVLIGLVAAIAVLGFVGWMIFRLGRLFSGEETNDSGGDLENKP